MEEETRQPTPRHYHRNGCTAQGETRATGNKPRNQIFVLGHQPTVLVSAQRVTPPNRAMQD